MNGWLPRRGTVTRIVEGLGRCATAPVLGAGLYGARSLGALIIGPTALGGGASFELAGGGSPRAISPVGPRFSELTSGLADGLDSVRDESESIEGTLEKYSEPRAPSLDFSPEGVVPSSLPVTVGSSVLAIGLAAIREIDWCA